MSPCRLLCEMLEGSDRVVADAISHGVIHNPMVFNAIMQGAKENAGVVGTYQRLTATLLVENRELRERVLDLAQRQTAKG